MPITKILTPTQTKAWDAFTIEDEPILAIDLMERASNACVIAMTALPVFQEAKSVHIFCGQGNNGGDGLAIARLLQENGHKVWVYIVSDSEHSTEDFNINLERLKKHNPTHIKSINATNDFELAENTVVIDAILGTGLNKPLQGIIKSTVEKINTSAAFVISIDAPTGFFSDLHANIETCINAHVTYTFQTPKLRMLFPESYAYTGEIKVLNIGLLAAFNLQAQSPYFYTTQEGVAHILKKRKKFDHKGVYGHALLIVGSYGKMGAAVLSTRACLRSGVGLLTVACPKSGYEIIQNAAPEAMAYVFEEYEKYLSHFPNIENFKAIGIGPGIDKKPVTKNAFKNFITQPKLPQLVLDADALNILAELLMENKAFEIPENTILTPHVKEFDRLAGVSENSFQRHAKQLAFAQAHKIYVVLKGAYTAIATPSGECYFNSTGNPGMATGGSGDVLTGIITGLLAQSYTPLEACLLGVYIHGLAGDKAAEALGENAMMATDIIEHLGKAFKSLQCDASHAMTMPDR